MGLPSVVGQLLPALDSAFPGSLLPVVEDFLVTHAGARSVEVLLADYDLLLLRRLPGSFAPPGETMPVDGSDAGRAFITQANVVVPVDGGVRVFVPITLRMERLGLLDVLLPQPPDADLLTGLAGTALALAYLLPTASNYSDLIERARRDRPLELSAEMQWSMLPVRAYGGPSFQLAGQLVPAYEVGGDLFDYAVEEDELLVYVIDAMGHGLQASVLGSLAVNALRNARRTGLSLGDQMRQADRVLYGEFGGERFVTGLALRIDTATGRADVVNAGHPPGHLIRDGRVQRLQVPADLPLGMFESTRYAEHPAALRAGDRLLLVSDGVLEATDPAGEEYGEHRLQGAMLATAALPAIETVRHLVRTLRDYQRDELRDDATFLCLDWGAATD